MWWAVKDTFRSFKAGKKPIPILQGAESVFGPFWKSAENVTSGIRSPERHPVAFPYTQYDIPDHINVKI